MKEERQRLDEAWKGALARDRAERWIHDERVRVRREIEAALERERWSRDLQ
jgi:hypothetical protein